MWTWKIAGPSTTGPSTDRLLTNELSFWSVVWVRDLSFDVLLPHPYVLTNNHQLRGVEQPTGCWLPQSIGAGLDSFWLNEGSFLKDPWLVLGDVCPDVSNPNIIVFDFRISYINFIKNEHIKLDETCQDTQGHFKANLLNVTDVIGCLISKLHETCKTDYN